MTNPTLVVLTTDDRLVSHGDTDAGVITDAGIIPWADVEYFLVWHVATQRYMSIPV